MKYAPVFIFFVITLMQDGLMGGMPGGKPGAAQAFPLESVAVNPWEVPADQGEGQPGSNGALVLGRLKRNTADDQMPNGRLKRKYQIVSGTIDPEGRYKREPQMEPGAWSGKYKREYGMQGDESFIERSKRQNDDQTDIGRFKRQNDDQTDIGRFKREPQMDYGDAWSGKYKREARMQEDDQMGGRF